MKGFWVWIGCITLALLKTPMLYSGDFAATPLDAWGDLHRTMQREAQANAEKIRIVFVGDSITARWTTSPGEKIWRDFYAPLGAINLGISADTTSNMLWRLQHGMLDVLKPKMFILLAGTNNLTFDNAQGTAYGVWTLVEQMRQRCPDARVLVLGLLPRSDREKCGQMIPEVNRYLQKLDDGKMVRYLYFGDKFLNPDGTVNTALLTDKLHPNTPEGFVIWQEAIKPIVTEWLNLPPVPGVLPPPAPVTKPANLASSTPTARNEFQMWHERFRKISPANKAKCKLLMFGGEQMVKLRMFDHLLDDAYPHYGVQNFAVWGARTANMLWQIQNGELEGMSPKVVVIQAQEELAGGHKANEVADEMLTIAHEIRQRLPQAKVLILGAFPRGHYANAPERKKVAAYNQTLASMVKGDGIFFLDVGKSLIKPDGTIDGNEVPSPQCHSRAAYESWLSAQSELIHNLMNGDGKQ